MTPIRGSYRIIHNNSSHSLLLLLFLCVVFIFGFPLIEQDHRGGRHPLFPRQQLDGDHVLMDGPVQVVEALQNNLGVEREESKFE